MVGRRGGGICSEGGLGSTSVVVSLAANTMDPTIVEVLYLCIRFKLRCDRSSFYMTTMIAMSTGSRVKVVLNRMMTACPVPNMVTIKYGDCCDHEPPTTARTRAALPIRNPTSNPPGNARVLRRPMKTALPTLGFLGSC